MTDKIRCVDMSADFYYALQAVAADAGFFADEGIEVEFNVVDTSKVPAVLNAGEADIALCGMWQPWMYVERLGMDYKVFAQLNQQVPLMLFSREPAEKFDWRTLPGAMDPGALPRAFLAQSPGLSDPQDVVAEPVGHAPWTHGVAEAGPIGSHFGVPAGARTARAPVGGPARGLRVAVSAHRKRAIRGTPRRWS